MPVVCQNRLESRTYYLILADFQEDPALSLAPSGPVPRLKSADARQGAGHQSGERQLLL